MGTVSAQDGKSVIFREDLGQPLVYVTLHPSEVPVMCRVGAAVAGNGEGEWHPFVEGDEVVVVIPEGYEDSGCVVICRLNNALDRFPMDSVAGQDPTTNTFAFRRSRTPYVSEYAGPVVLRSALSSALITIDETGNITLKDSQNAALQISADVIGFAGPSDPSTAPDYLLQLDLTHGHLNVQVGDAVLTLSRSGASPEVNTITVPGAMTLGSVGNAPVEHVTTAEQVANLLEKYTAILATTIAAVPVFGSAIGGAITAWLATPAFAAVWTTAAVAPSGAICTTLPLVVQAAITSQPPKQAGIPYQATPGVGCVGLLAG